MTPIENRAAVKDGVVLTFQIEGERKPHIAEVVQPKGETRTFYVVDGKEIVTSVTTAAIKAGWKRNGWDAWSLAPGEKASAAARALVSKALEAGQSFRASRSQSVASAAKPAKTSNPAPAKGKASESAPSASQGKAAERAQSVASAPKVPRQSSASSAKPKASESKPDGSRDVQRVRAALKAAGESSVAAIMQAAGLKTGDVTRALKALGAVQGSRAGMWTLAKSADATAVAA